MTLPIYQQTRSAVPCEWVYDDDLDPIEIDRGNIITADTPPGLDWVVAFTLGLLVLVSGIVMYLAAMPV